MVQDEDAQRWRCTGNRQALKDTQFPSSFSDHACGLDAGIPARVHAYMRVLCLWAQDLHSQICEICDKRLEPGLQAS